VDLGVTLLAVVAVVAIARLVVTDAFSHETRARQRLSRRARVAIAEAPDGLVRLTGRVHPMGEPLKAPISQRPCVAFQLVIRMKDGQGRWAKVQELEDARPFTLADESGQAVVDTAAGPFSLSLVPSRSASSSFFLSDTADLRIVRAMLRSANIETENIFGHEHGVRFSEAVLLPASKAAVGGRCAREVALDGERAGYRDVPQRLIVRGTSEERLVISNWREALEKE